jgi:hypothetical protein
MSLAPGRRRADALLAEPFVQQGKPPRRITVIAGVGLAALLAAWTFSDARAPASNRWASPAQAAEQQCHVTYQVTHDDGSRFEAAITIQNGAQAQQPTRLSFPWPGDQKMLDASAATWKQTGRDVVVEPQNGATSVALAGSYGRLNALPAKFIWNGMECSATVIGAPAASLVQIERVSGSADDDGDDDGDGNGRGGKGKRGKGGGDD